MSDMRCISKDVIVNFIGIYRKHPALWKVKSNEYKNRNLKNKGYDELLEFYKKCEPKADRETVQKKIQSLRGSFRKELKKVQKSKRSGKSADEIYTSSLWYYDLLSFTIEHDKPTDSIFSLEENNDENEDEAEVLREQAGEGVVCSWSNKRKNMKRKAEQTDQEFLKACTAVLQTKPTNDEDQYDVFGKYISQKMKNIKSEEQRLFAEGLIMQTMQKAALNKLNENSIILENPTCSSLISIKPSPSTPQDFCNDA